MTIDNRYVIALEEHYYDAELSATFTIIRELTISSG